jgi:hypothetical protein
VWRLTESNILQTTLMAKLDGRNGFKLTSDCTTENDLIVTPSMPARFTIRELTRTHFTKWIWCRVVFNRDRVTGMTTYLLRHQKKPYATNIVPRDEDALHGIVSSQFAGGHLASEPIEVPMGYATVHKLCETDDVRAVPDVVEEKVFQIHAPN